MRERKNANYQSTGEEGSRKGSEEKVGSSIGFLSAKARGLSEGVYGYAEKAKLGLTKSGQNQINQWERGYRLYTRDRA